jgi:hypothetical protein
MLIEYARVYSESLPAWPFLVECHIGQLKYGLGNGQFPVFGFNHLQFSTWQIFHCQVFLIFLAPFRLDFSWFQQIWTYHSAAFTALNLLSQISKGVPFLGCVYGWGLDTPFIISYNFVNTHCPEPLKHLQKRDVSSRLVLGEGNPLPRKRSLHELFQVRETIQRTRYAMLWLWNPPYFMKQITVFFFNGAQPVGTTLLVMSK